MRTYCKEFGALIRQHREKMNWTREFLAERCDISDRCISNIERGVAEPKLGTIIKLCHECGINIGDLESLTDDENLMMYLI